MSQVVVKVDISPELKDEFIVALNKVVNEFIEDVQFSLAERILSKSKLTKGQAFKLADEVKSAMARRHGIHWISKMMLVVEANIVFQALIRRGFIFKLIRQLLKLGTKLYSPEFILEEIDKREERLSKYSGLTKIELEFLIRILFKKIEVIPVSKYSKFLPKALELFPHHFKDAPYFALAMSSSEFALWSDEKRHKKQSKVKVYTTSELLKELGLK